MNKRKLLQLSLTVLALYLLFCAAAGILVAEAVLHPARNPLTATEKAQAQTSAQDDDATLSDVSTTAEDGMPLKAWELRPEDATGDVVILLHGLRGNRLEMMNYADMLVTHGYSVLMPDARAHGESGGSVATYGLLERSDVHRWFEWLAANRNPHCVYGFGESMGAAQILQALEAEPRFCAVAAECSFSTLRESAYDRIGQRFHTGPWLGRTIFRPVVESAYVYVRLRYKLDMNQVSPEDAVAATKVPVLLIHGQSDTNIPLRHAVRIAARNGSVAVWEPPKTGHSNAIDTSPRELEAKLVWWFGTHPEPVLRILESKGE
jgi:fermentation-respiration switch protein FrsA (DUF1100 family)